MSSFRRPRLPRISSKRRPLLSLRLRSQQVRRPCRPRQPITVSPRRRRPALVQQTATWLLRRRQARPLMLLGKRECHRTTLQLSLLPMAGGLACRRRQRRQLVRALLPPREDPELLLEQCQWPERCQRPPQPPCQWLGQRHRHCRPWKRATCWRLSGAAQFAACTVYSPCTLIACDFSRHVIAASAQFCSLELCGHGCNLQC